MPGMISVIIPVYNVEKFLRQCLDSVLTQTFCNLEVIAVDDGSTDSSGNICDEYLQKDNRVRVIHKPNGGLASARNSGLDIARGEWIFFLDSDDYIVPDCLECLYVTATDSGADIVTAASTHSENSLGKGSDVCVLDSKTAIWRTLHQTHRMLNMACAKLYRRNIFDTERFTEGRWYEDLDAFYRFFDRARTIAVVSKVMYFYRLHSNSFLGHWTPQRLQVLDVMQRMREWMDSRMPEMGPAIDDREFSAACNMFLLMSRECPDNPAMARCWKLIRKHRAKVLFGKGVRAKNRIGALVSYLGRRFFSFLS